MWTVLVFYDCPMFSYPAYQLLELIPLLFLDHPWNICHIQTQLVAHVMEVPKYE